MPDQTSPRKSKKSAETEIYRFNAEFMPRDKKILEALLVSEDAASFIEVIRIALRRLHAQRVFEQENNEEMCTRNRATGKVRGILII